AEAGLRQAGLAVRDTGVGIESGLFPRLLGGVTQAGRGVDRRGGGVGRGRGSYSGLLPGWFETFTQADRSLDRSKGGLGLGLSLVKGLVELHGGSVEAKSDGPGRASEVWVRLHMH